jgi:capsular polysaccharide biosynthesis protein
MGLVVNRDELDPVLERHGIVAVDPDEMAVRHLLSLYREADLVVGVHGSGLSHALFSRRAHLVELLRAPTMVPRIYYLAASTGLPYDYVPTRDAIPADGDLAADRTAVVVDVEWLDALLTRLS